MKKIAFILAILMVMIIEGNVWAMEQFCGSFSSNIASEYILTNGATVYRKPVWSNSLFILHKQSGMSAFVWGQRGLESGETGGDEVDLVLAWNKSIESYNFSIGVAYLDLIELTNLPDGDIIQPFVSLEKEFDPVSFYVKVETPFPSRGGAPKNGYHVFGGIRNVWEFYPQWSFGQDLQLMYDSGACGFDEGLIGRHEMALNYSMIENLSLNIKSIISIPLSKMDDGREFEVIPSIGITYKF